MDAAICHLIDYVDAFLVRKLAPGGMRRRHITMAAFCVTASGYRPMCHADKAIVVFLIFLVLRNRTWLFKTLQYTRLLHGGEIDSVLLIEKNAVGIEHTAAKLEQSVV